MGAELIVITVVGPKKLNVSDEFRDILVAKAERRIAACKKWSGGKLPRGLDDEQEVELTADLDARTVVERTIAFWNSPSEKDTCWRIAKVGDQTLKIVVAGDSTWGDTPDGEGYRLLVDAARLRILDELGLK